MGKEKRSICEAVDQSVLAKSVRGEKPGCTELMAGRKFSSAFK